MSKRLSTGRLISDSFGMLAENAPTFIGLAFLATLPVAVVNIAQPSGVLGLLLAPIAALIQGILVQLVTAAITYAVFTRLRGSTAPPIGECLAIVGKRWIPVLLASLLVGVATILGFLLLFVPGLIVMTMLFVTIPVVVVESPGVLTSLERSADLTRGHRWSIFFLILVLYVMNAVLIFGLAMVIAGTLGPGLVAMTLPTMLISTATTALQATAAGLTYYRLREVKEQLDLNDLARVFQ